MVPATPSLSPTSLILALLGESSCAGSAHGTASPGTTCHFCSEFTLCHPSGNTGEVPGLQLIFWLHILGETEQGAALGRAGGMTSTRNSLFYSTKSFQIFRSGQAGASPPLLLEFS